MAAPVAPVGASAIGRLAPPPAVAPPAAGGSGFADALAKGIESIGVAERHADSLVVQMAAGGNVAPHEVMIATQKAALTVEMVVAVRDKALEAYREIMNLQL